MLTAEDLRKKYLEFFEKKGHAVIPSASLIPENDPTVLFTTAGMHPLVPYLMGEKHPLGKRLTDVQKCIRTTDIDEVGDATHHTFFEMLGNWSLGDYFKEDTIKMSWEFLTDSKWLGLDKKRLAISVFAGDEDAPFDNEAFDIWKNIGIPEKRIAKLPKKDNWWGPAGETGPCGPDTEMFYWVGEDSAPEKFDSENKLWVEIWNDVFMQYNKTIDGKFEPLKQKNVDTGMGLERTLAVVNGLDDNYKTELFLPIIEKIEELSGKKYQGNERAFRIIADHIKAATIILSDDKAITPSNVGAGYVLRRLIRRAVRYGRMIGIDNNFISLVAETAVQMYQDVYSEVLKNKKFILEQLDLEEDKFKKSLSEGIKVSQKILDKKIPLETEQFKSIMAISIEDRNRILRELFAARKTGNLKKELKTIKINITEKEFEAAAITGKEAFDLYQSYGFPIERIIELAQEKRLLVDVRSFREKLQKHQDLSRTASAGMFKGGLADAGKETTKYHTATHLLLAALREILGPETYQKGSNITAERLRFDFNYPQKLTSLQLQRVEDLVNQKIQEKIPVEMMEMPKTEALKIAKVSFDPAKYGDTVKVYKIGDFSIELCGGPHVKNTGELGKFKIQKEEASSAGIRRIKAVLE